MKSQQSQEFERIQKQTSLLAEINHRVTEFRRNRSLGSSSGYDDEFFRQGSNETDIQRPAPQTSINENLLAETDTDEKEADLGAGESDDECQMPTHIRIEFSERHAWNKVLYVLYRSFRFFFITVWFYFAPFIAMFASYIIPYAFNKCGPQRINS